MARVLFSQEVRLWSFDAASWFENVPKPIIRYRLSVTHMSQSFGMHFDDFRRYDEANLASKFARGPRPVYRCPWRLRFLIRYRMLPFSPTRRRSSLRVLSPRSRPALGLTSLFADTHHRRRFDSKFLVASAKWQIATDNTLDVRASS